MKNDLYYAEDFKEGETFNLGTYNVTKKEIIDFAQEKEITLFSTAFDIPSAEFLENLNMPIYKIPSGGLKNIPLIKQSSSNSSF